MEYIKGPDFPTAGIIMGRSGIRAAYATGRGKITLRGRATIEETKNGRTQIIIRKFRIWSTRPVSLRTWPTLSRRNVSRHHRPER